MRDRWLRILTFEGLSRHLIRFHTFGVDYPGIGTFVTQIPHARVSNTLFVMLLLSKQESLSYGCLQLAITNHVHQA